MSTEVLGDGTRIATATEVEQETQRLRQAEKIYTNDKYALLCDKIATHPRLQRIITAHIKELSGHSTLPNFHKNGDSDAEKAKVYDDCLFAIAQNDFSSLKSVSVRVVVPDQSAVAMEGGAFIPDIDPTFIVSDGHQDILKVVVDSSAESPQNLMVTGPAGAGKTSMGLYLAAVYKRPVLIMDCQNIREPRDWFGQRHAKAGDTYWKDARFVRCVEQGNHVIVIDEINRTAPTVNNTLLPLLDERRFTYVEERGDVVRVGKGTIFFATMNEGANFTGTNVVDDALSDRFTRRLEVQFLKPAQEADVIVKRTGLSKAEAKRIADVGAAIRNKSQAFGGTLTKTLSTRRLVDAARDFKRIGAKALEFSITNHFPAEGGNASERAQVLQIIQGKFPPGVV